MSGFQISFLQQFNDPQFSDIRVKLEDGSRLNLHKLVLWCNFEYFQTALSSGSQFAVQRDEDGVAVYPLVIPDCPQESVVLCLQRAYGLFHTHGDILAHFVGLAVAYRFLNPLRHVENWRKLVERINPFDRGEIVKAVFENQDLELNQLLTIVGPYDYTNGFIAIKDYVAAYACNARTEDYLFKQFESDAPAFEKLAQQLVWFRVPSMKYAHTALALQQEILNPPALFLIQHGELKVPIEPRRVRFETPGFGISADLWVVYGVIPGELPGYLATLDLKGR